MAFFIYRALTNEGKEIKGGIEASDLRQLRLFLREQQLFLVDARERKSGVVKVPLAQLVPWMLQLAQLLRSGLALFDSLSVLRQERQSQALERITTTLAEGIRSGKSFREGLAMFPKVFDQQTLAVVRAAEASGTLDLAVAQIAEQLQSQWRLKRQWASLLVYPCLLLGVAAVVIALLLFFVIPALEPLFGQRIEGITAIVVGASQIARQQGGWLLPSIVALVAILYWQYTHGAKERLTLLFVKMPMVSALWARLSLVRFFGSMAHLQEAGVALVDAFAISRQTVSHPLLARDFRWIEKQLFAGKSLSVLLGQCKEMPPTAVQILTIAERSSGLVKAMRQIALLYEEQATQQVTRLMQSVQPVLLIGLALCVGVVLLALLVPLTQGSLHLVE